MEMDHPLENLGPERFQQLCQAMFTKEFPGVSCLPIGQPDGGRDAIQRMFEAPEGAFTVFQVKFSRSALTDKDAREWVLHAAKGEIDKVKNLKKRGATRYLIATNVAGTSHLNVGSIDTLQSELTTLLGLEVLCWWRDDINRRLDASWDLKLRYPDVLSGQDFLRLLLSTTQGEHHERRYATLKAFLAGQYEEDREVKFKQVELQNKLLDLFVDLPFTIRTMEPPDVRQFAPSDLLNLHWGQAPDDTSFVISDASEENDDSGTATLLLRESTAPWLSQLVVEGAPGQGKSTLA
jgi:hypothetical protein